MYFLADLIPLTKAQAYKKGSDVLKYNNIAKVKAIEAVNKKKLLDVNSELNESSGIYFLTRTDENNIKYAYIGQA